VTRRSVQYSDGWFPRPGRGFEITQQLARLRRMAEEKGRDPQTISTSVFRAPPDQAALAQYAAAGIDGAVLEIPDLSRDEILRVLGGCVPLLA
jgi:alkanesulfonate monooxygenase SsuD/methylene tetrahydromethanopterin reductase-like flavin-dependent oxidoreductase (luciferase family)